MDSSKDIKQKWRKVLRIIVVLAITGTFLIALFACIPTMSIASGNDFFEMVGSFIRKHNEIFFTMIFFLCIFCGLACFFQLSLENRIDNDDLSLKELKQQDATKRINGKCDSLNQSLSKLDKDLEISSISVTAKIEKCNETTNSKVIVMKNTYENHLANYYQTNSKIYNIIKHTILENSNSIKKLIDAYSHLK